MYNHNDKTLPNYITAFHDQVVVVLEKKMVPTLRWKMLNIYISDFQCIFFSFSVLYTPYFTSFNTVIEATTMYNEPFQFERRVKSFETNIDFKSKINDMTGVNS
jgi:hypothetical protein